MYKAVYCRKNHF